jgi:hypothetical protein
MINPVQLPERGAAVDTRTGWMKRSLKIGLVVAAVVAAGAAVGGVAVAATTTTTHPITLCVGTLLSNVTGPGGDGRCDRLQTTITVASAGDVAALAARMDAADETNALQDLKIESITNRTNADRTIFNRRFLEDEAKIASQQAAFDKLKASLPGSLTATNVVNSISPGIYYDATVNGSSLQPGSHVWLNETGYGAVSEMGQADADGYFGPNVRPLRAT